MTQVIADGLQVSVHYRLTLDDGTVADDSFDGDPMVYIHGAGQIVPGLERQLAGKSAGDEFQLQVEAADAYGEYDPAAEQAVPRDKLPADAKIQPGMPLQAKGPHGPVTVWISRVQGDDVIISTNHPLAGQRLSFQVRIVDVRAATAEQSPSDDSG